jgi:hypothetical protein
MSNDLLTGQEPQLGGEGSILTGHEPALGGQLRPPLDLTLFWDLLSSNPDARREAVSRALATPSAARYYGMTLVKVLIPGARYRRMMWRARYTVMHKLAALDSVGQLDADCALRALTVVQKDNDPVIRSSALMILGELEMPEVERIVLRSLDDPSEEVQEAALRAVAARWNEPRLTLLINPDRMTALQAARSLLKDVNVGMLLPLLAVLQYQRNDDEKDIIRGTITTALGILALQLGKDQQQRVVDVFERLVDEGNIGSYLGLQIIRVLKIISSEAAHVALTDYLAEHGQELGPQLSDLEEREYELLTDDDDG